jgi:hypothetical protein
MQPRRTFRQPARVLRKADYGRSLHMSFINSTFTLLPNTPAHYGPNFQDLGERTMHGAETYITICGSVTRNMVCIAPGSPARPQKADDVGACPYVRYSPNYLLFDTTQACKGLVSCLVLLQQSRLTLPLDIYGHNKNMQKSLPYLAMVHNTPSTFTLRNKKEHAWKKRILSQKFSDSAIRSYEPEVLKLVDRFCDALCPKPSEKSESATPETKSPWSEPFDMSTWC